LLCLAIAALLTASSIAQDLPLPDRDRLHQSDQWAQVQSHLPDPATATPQALELQADILRARRFPQDALDYYRYAVARGGNSASLLNKLGLAELEMRNIELARAYFQRAVKLDRKYAEAWNNLGAVEYLDRTSDQAVSDYKRAIKLDKHDAVFRANLATACFERKDFGQARRQITEALKIDPTIFERREGTGGIAAHVLTAEDHARFSYEMARLYAREGLEEQMLHALAVASEAGMDVQHEMHRDPALAKFELDPRVVVLVRNAHMLRVGHADSVSESSPVASPAQPAPKPTAE
jgi:tetratricopeptide (TPR) repeat protein